jgi:hypothetical protein
MRQDMKDTCEDCPDFAACTELCEEMKSQLEELPKWSKEKAESQYTNEQRDGEKDSDDFQGIDRFRNINPARVYEDADPTKIDWEETPPQPRAVEIGESERRHLKNQIGKAIRNDGPKFKRRFYSFLRCENIKDIAKRSGTTKQNVQQQLYRRVKKVYRMFNKQEIQGKKIITPLQFKLKVSFADF